MTKPEALAKFLEGDEDDLSEASYSVLGGEGTLFEYGGQEYLVCTDEEADRAVREYIKESAWVFNADFIIDHSKLPYDAKEMVEAYQEAKCEGANETILALIEDFEEFCDDAVASDGRGHFLADYDGEENEQDGFFIYRTN
ncbi:MAG: hypothetical protein ACYDB1_09570 [Acidiferrobacteraceae bacterium]